MTVATSGIALFCFLGGIAALSFAGISVASLTLPNICIVTSALGAIITAISLAAASILTRAQKKPQVDEKISDITAHWTIDRPDYSPADPTSPLANADSAAEFRKELRLIAFLKSNAPNLAADALSLKELTSAIDQLPHGPHSVVETLVLALDTSTDISGLTRLCFCYFSS